MPRTKLSKEDRETKGARAKNDAPPETEIEADLPQRPDRLSAQARRYWDQIIPRMVAKGLVCSLDEDLLADYCEVVTTKNLYQERLNETCEYTKAHANNTESQSLDYKIWKDLCKEATRLGELLGLSPKARKQMGIKLKKKDQSGGKQTKASALYRRSRPRLGD